MPSVVLRHQSLYYGLGHFCGNLFNILCSDLKILSIWLNIIRYNNNFRHSNTIVLNYLWHRFQFVYKETKTQRLLEIHLKFHIGLPSTTSILTSTTHIQFLSC